MLHEHIVAAGFRQISRNDLEKYIRTYVVASPGMVELYVHRMCVFSFLKVHPQKAGIFLVNQENVFFPRGTEAEAKFDEKDVKTIVHKDSNRVFEATETSLGQQSKTKVYLVDRGVKKTCSFKGFVGTWDAYCERVKSLGLDICYVQDAWENALLHATMDDGFVHVPVQLLGGVLNVTVVLPYVVNRPRRLRRKVTEEEAEF